MRAMILLPVVILALAQPLFGQEYYIEASRTAIVRDRPDTGGELRLRLERGQQLNAVTDQQTEGFYHVYLPNGETGWVSRYVVRLHPGPAPLVTEVAVMPHVGGGLTEVERQHAAFHLAIGKPRGYQEIIREGYVTGYDPRLKIPVWVQYRLTRARSDDNRYERTDDFDEDGQVPPQARATLNDYAGWDGVYVRGHMAPAEDMRWSESAEEQSNLLTNIAPQIGDHYNNSIWKTLENRVRTWVTDREDLTIICGPVFETTDRVRDIDRQPRTERQQLHNVIGENDVAVPTAFYKIVVDMRNMQRPNVLAFLIPHIDTEEGPERRIETHVTSVDRIEELTGLDFLPGLSDIVQEEIESVVPTTTW